MASPFRTLCVASANRRATTTNRCSRRSPWPLTALGRYALDDHAETVVTLLDKLGVRGCEVIGHSAGGSIAVLIAARRPDLVSALVVADGNLDPGGGAFSASIAA